MNKQTTKRNKKLVPIKITNHSDVNNSKLIISPVMLESENSKSAINDSSGVISPKP